MWPKPQETADLVTFTKEILYGKLYLCSVTLIYDEKIIYESLDKEKFD